MVTIKSVASLAGVSTATVSRVLNGNTTVARELADRVFAAVNESGYRPNAVARSLRTQTSNLLALLIPDISNPFYTAVARGVEDVAQKAGYSVFLCNTDDVAEKEAMYLSDALRVHVAGVVISPQETRADLSGLEQARVPFVLIDRTLRGGQNDAVLVRSFEGARDATRHLIEEGWRRPAIVTGPRSATTARARLRGYRAAVKEAGLEDVVEYTDYRREGGQDAMARLLDSTNPPDAVLVANAPMALGVLTELSDRGVRVGTEIGVVTFDDALWAPYVSPPITVVALPAYEIGRRAADLLIDVLQTGPVERPRQVTLPAELVVRRSSLKRSAG